jgi:CBS domain-containing protein
LHVNSVSPHLVLAADIAADMMAPNPISIRDGALLEEAIAVLADKHLDVVPVIDKAGRPVGVISQGDILIHEREAHAHAKSAQAAQTATEPNLSALRSADEKCARVQARDIMTPVLFSVSPATPAIKVVEQLLELHVKQLFVVDDGDALVGSISALDILRKLGPNAE